jgi:hypothetical protein
MNPKVAEGYECVDCVHVVQDREMVEPLWTW